MKGRVRKSIFADTPLLSCATLRASSSTWASILKCYCNCTWCVCTCILSNVKLWVKSMIGWIYISFCVCFFLYLRLPAGMKRMDGWWSKAKSNADRMWQPTGHFLLSQLKFSVSWQIGGWTQMAFLSALNCWRHTSSMESSLPKQTSSEPSGEKLFLVCHFCLPLKTLESSPQATWHMEKRGLCTLPHAQISVLVILNLCFLPVSASNPFVLVVV